MAGPDSSSPDVLRLTTGEAAQVLVRPEDRRYLEPFLGRALGTAEAARLVGVTTEQMAYRVASLRRRGLLHPAGAVERPGRAIELHEAATRIEAPLDLLPQADLADLFEVIDAGARRAFLGALSRLAGRSGLTEWLVRCYRADDGGVRLDMVPTNDDRSLERLVDAAAPAVTFNWIPAALDDEGAKRLQRELAEVVARIPVATGRPTHLVGLFLTPLT